MSSWFGYSSSEPPKDDEGEGVEEKPHPARRRRADEGATFTAAKCPGGPGLNNSCEMPFGILWTPMAAYDDQAQKKDGKSHKMSVIECKNEPMPPVLCLACLTYINPFVELDKETGIWSCPLCGHENVLPKEELREGSRVMTALTSTCVEYRQKASPYGGDDGEEKKEDGHLDKNAKYNRSGDEEEDYCTYVLVVDENLSPKDGQAIAPAVEAIFNEQISGRDGGESGPKARIALVSFGKSVSIYQLGFSGVASADVYVRDDSKDNHNEFGKEVENRAYLWETQAGGGFTSLRNSLSSIFGVPVDDVDDETTETSSGFFSSRMAMLSQRKEARLRKEENGDDSGSNTAAKSPWVKHHDAALTENRKRRTGEALECALELANASVSKPSRTSRIILFTNGCPNVGDGNVVSPLDKSKNKKGRRAMYDVVDTEMLQKAVEYFDTNATVALSAGIGIDVFCCGVTELALPVYQAMVEPSGGYVLSLVTLDTPQLQQNLKYIVTNTYMSRSVSVYDTSWEGEDGAECILDIRTDSFVNPSQMCGSCEMLASGGIVDNELYAFKEGSSLAVAKGFKVKNLPSEKAIELSLTRIQMGRVDPLSTITVLMDIDDTVSSEDEYAFFQLIARYISRKGKEEITRVSSFKIPVAENVNDFVSGVDDEAMSVVLGKVAVYRALHGREETEDTRDLITAADVDSQEKLAYDTQVDLDATVQRISGAYRLLDLENKSVSRRKSLSEGESSQSSLDFAFPPNLKEMLNRLYHLRRGPLISPGPMRSLDDRAEKRGLFTRLPVEDCLKMIRPSVWSTGSMSVSSGWDNMLPFPPETLALWDDSIVAADFHDSLFVWSGANCAATRYDGIREKFNAHLLEMSKHRFPMPGIHELTDGDSMSRRFTSRLAPSHADPIDNQLVHFPALSALKPAALEDLRSKFKFYDSKSDASFRTWFWNVASASNKSRLDGMSLSE